MPLRRQHSSNHNAGQLQPMSIDRPFTPVSPLNLEPLTSRSQQVSLQELAFINEHLLRNSHPTHHHGVNHKTLAKGNHQHGPAHAPYNSHRTPRSGWSTPLLSANSPLSGSRPASRGGSGTGTPVEEDYFGGTSSSTAHHDSSHHHAHFPPSSAPFSPSSLPHSPFTFTFEYDEEDDIRTEVRADAERPFPVDRAILKEIIRSKMGADVERVVFLSSGTFHKAFLATLSNGLSLVARLARRFMPTLKTASEVATLNYLRLHTSIPVPRVYAWDANPYNRLGYEWILMEKANGVPLAEVWHGMGRAERERLVRGLAGLIVSGDRALTAKGFSHVGSLYQKRKGNHGMGKGWPVGITMIPVPTPPLPGAKEAQSLPPAGLASTHSSPSAPISSLPPPTAATSQSLTDQGSSSGSTISSSDFSSSSPATSLSSASTAPSTTTDSHSHSAAIVAPPIPIQGPADSELEFFIGPIVAWPFFGDGRGELDSLPAPLSSTSTSAFSASFSSFPTAIGIPRGPFPSESAYLQACAAREIDAVRREGEGAERGHRPHLPPRDRLRASGSRGGTGVYTLGGRRGLNGRSLSRSGTGGPRFGLGSSGLGMGMTRSSSVDESAESSRAMSPTSEEDGSIVSGSDSSTSQSSDSEDEDTFYRDYRATLRSSLLVAQHAARTRAVEEDMRRFGKLYEREARRVERELGMIGGGGEGGEFVIHAHDLSLANIFVDETDPTKITCIIDWESSTIRPLWHAAHLPSFLLPPPPHAHNATAHKEYHAHHAPPHGLTASSTSTPGAGGPDPELGEAFRRYVREVAAGPSCAKSMGLGGGDAREKLVATRWLKAESSGERLREMHRFLEWDGWEQGLLEGVLGSIVGLLEEEEASEEEAKKKAAAGAGTAVGVGGMAANQGRGNGTFKMRNGFIGLSLT